MCNMYGIIEELCNGKNMKIGALCSALGISRGIMGDLKAGRTKKLSAGNLSKIAGYFDISIDELVGTEKKEKLDISEEDAELNEYLEILKNRSEMRMLFKLTKGATKEDVEKAVKIIEALRE